MFDLTNVLFISYIDVKITFDNKLFIIFINTKTISEHNIYNVNLPAAALFLLPVPNVAQPASDGSRCCFLRSTIIRPGSLNLTPLSMSAASDWPE